MTSTDALATALAAEHAAVFGYGAVGARLDAANQADAHEAEAMHRSRRDDLVIRIAAAGASPPASSPAYALPFPVTDQDSALKLAVALEDGTAKAWRRIIADTEGDERKLAVEALMDCAVRATHWRLAAGVTPSTLPFPGSPT
jgi:hypothetical protein